MTIARDEMRRRILDRYSDPCEALSAYPVVVLSPPSRSIAARPTTSCNSLRNDATGTCSPECSEAKASAAAMSSISPSSGGRPASAKGMRVSHTCCRTIIFFLAASIAANVIVISVLGSLMKTPSTESGCHVEERP